MRTNSAWRWISLVMVCWLAFSTARMPAWAERPPPLLDDGPRTLPQFNVLPSWAELPLEPEPATIVPDPDPPPPSNTRISPPVPRESTLSRAPGGIQTTSFVTFTNTWAYNTIGLVYNPAQGIVRYAHESQSSTHNPTVYDVDYLSHSPVFSFALSTVNSSWPWQIDNRTGAGYDFVRNTYFLPDYNGDLSYADDNIVEVTPNGVILNAWEMDDEVGSNDSSDGSVIDSIIDIAVVPGSPTRYFVSAAYDGSVVYEIELIRTGTWWTPNSWRTVATYTIPGLTDNLGIDYDAQNEVLYHSDWDTTTIVVTDLGCNELARFDCPGAGGFNSGVTFIEGSDPPEVWVTDFSSDQTTICPSPYGGQGPEPGWGKLVLGPLGPEPWYPGLTLQTQTSDTITIIDVITATEAFTLTELWDPAHLQLLNWRVDPPVGTVVTGTGMLQIIVPPGPPLVVEVTKWFHVEPCTWITTTVEEVLRIGDLVFPVRSFTVEKLAPILWITSDYSPPVFAGTVSTFTLIYSNTGGYEHDITVANTFPITTPFVFSEPPPTIVHPDGRVEWRVGDLATGVNGTIDVFFLIDESIVPSTTFGIWGGIYNHVDELVNSVISEFHVEEYVPPPIDWFKFVNGVEWYPGIGLTLETSQTFEVIDVIMPHPENVLILVEEWDPTQLSLVGFGLNPEYGTVIPGPNGLTWVIPPSATPVPVELIKFFHVESCTWTETVLWEELLIEDPDGVFVVGFRPVLINKIPPELWITSTNNSGYDVYSGDLVSFTLHYGNDGGHEDLVIIRNEFPPEAIFVASDPPPTAGGPGAPLVEWRIPEDSGQITVTVEIAPGLMPSTTIEIWDGIFNHADELEDWTLIEYHVPPPEWWKWVNGELWFPGFDVGVYTSDTITVTDVISTGSDLALIEYWNPEHLTLVGYILTPDVGVIQQGPGIITWEFPDGAPRTVTMTKIFHVEPCTWTYTVLWEDLVIEGYEWERRPVHIDKPPIELTIDSFFDVFVMAGHAATFELEYTNLLASDHEFGAWIRNAFPPEAPFAGSIPPPNDSAPDGSWAIWDLPPLAPGDSGIINVTVDIDPALPPGSIVEIWDGIYNHAGELEDSTVIEYHVLRGIYLPLVMRNF